MRYIPRNGKEPDPDWIVRADALTKRLKAPGMSATKREKLIDDNEGLWKELKSWLQSLSSGKCWYSEARDCASYWHVDHFRPKIKIQDLDGNEYEGYWWLAFEWSNYRLAGGAINIPKSTKFPVREGTCWACSPDDDVDDEFPYLLDPTCPGDPPLLNFSEQGRPIPGEPHDVWNKERADKSIEILNLDSDNLNRERQRVWNTCSKYARMVLLCKDTISQTASIAKKQKMADGLDELRKMVSRDTEFSAVADRCIRAQGSKWLERSVF